MGLELPDIFSALLIVKGIHLDGVTDELLLDCVVEGHADSSFHNLLSIEGFCSLGKRHTLALVEEDLAAELRGLGTHSRVKCFIVEIVRVDIFLVHRQEIFVQHCARVKLRHEH